MKSDTASTVILWAPRILGVLVSLFIGMFALDALGEGIRALLIHLAPALLLLLVVAVAWRWPWVGGVVFTALALLYAVSVLHRPDWILAISGPLFVVGVLFLWSWRHQAKTKVG